MPSCCLVGGRGGYAPCGAESVGGDFPHGGHHSKRGGVRTVMVSVGALAGDSVYLTGAKSTGVTGTIEVYPLDMQQ